MQPITSSLIVLAATFAGLTGCRDSEKPLDFRIYSPDAKNGMELTFDDVNKDSVRTIPSSQDSISLYLKFTSSGAKKFRVLTRTLAARGAKMHRVMRLNFAVDGRVRSRIPVNYRVFPDGIDARQGLQIEGVDLQTASKIVEASRD